MKKLLAVISLLFVMGVVSGCNSTSPKTEHAARRVEQRDRTIRRDLGSLPDDIETFWLYDEPGHLSRWEH